MQDSLSFHMGFSFLNVNFLGSDNEKKLQQEKYQSSASDTIY